MRLGIILGTVAVLHVVWQVDLLSPLLLPLSAAFIISTLPSRVVWLMVGGTIAEFFSSLPPGILLTAVLTPLAIQLAAGNFTPQFSWRFLLTSLLVTFVQVVMIVGVSVFMHGISGIPLPGTLWLLGGTTIASFLGAAVWHEYE